MKRQNRALYIAIKVGEHEIHLTKTGRIVFPEGGAASSDVLMKLITLRDEYAGLLTSLEEKLDMRVCTCPDDLPAGSPHNVNCDFFQPPDPPRQPYTPPPSTSTI